MTDWDDVQHGAELAGSGEYLGERSRPDCPPWLLPQEAASQASRSLGVRYPTFQQVIGT